MSLAGLELNATYARAVSGPEGIPPLAVLLDGDDADLPMALSIENRRPEVGRAGVALARQYPHLACVDFLAYVGTSRAWGTRRPLNGAKAMALVFDRLRPALVGTSALVLALPGYLASAQAQLLLSLAQGEATLGRLGSRLGGLHTHGPCRPRAVWLGDRDRRR